LLGQFVEAHVLIAGESRHQGARGSWRASPDFERLSPSGLKLRMATRLSVLDGQIFLDAELHVHKGGSFGINLTPPHGQFSGHLHSAGRASLKPRGVVELGVEKWRAGPAKAPESENTVAISSATATTTKESTKTAHVFLPLSTCLFP